MSRRTGHSIPKYRKHRGSGQAVVTIAGRDHYLGPHRSKASRIEYDRLITEWLAAGRPATIAEQTDITVSELIVQCGRWIPPLRLSDNYPAADGRCNRREFGMVGNAIGLVHRRTFASCRFYRSDVDPAAP